MNEVDERRVVWRTRAVAFPILALLYLAVVAYKARKAYPKERKRRRRR